MYTIYVNEFLRNGTVVTTEEIMYTIPGDYPDDEMLQDPKVKNEMGKADTFEFGMESDNPWYSSLLQMKSRFRVELDGNTIFFGRVLSISTDMYGKKSVHCEGALAFLLDTLMISTKEEEREKISLPTYIESLIDSHNNLTEDWKHFALGEVPGHYSSEIADEQKISESAVRAFGTGSWTSVLNCLEEITSKYGGYLRARYVNGTNYIDLLRYYFKPVKNNQPLRVGENVIDISNTVDVNGMFTVLIPEGQAKGKPLYLDDPRSYTVKTPVVKPKEAGGE